jgi:plasmid maintenance system antidote protein VapI
MTPNHVTQMHNPPHPGEFIEGVYLEPCGLSIRQVAERLDVSASTFQRLDLSALTPMELTAA